MLRAVLILFVLGCGNPTTGQQIDSGTIIDSRIHDPDSSIDTFDSGIDAVIVQDAQIIDASIVDSNIADARITDSAVIIDAGPVIPSCTADILIKRTSIDVLMIIYCTIGSTANVSIRVFDGRTDIGSFQGPVDCFDSVLVVFLQHQVPVNPQVSTFFRDPATIGAIIECEQTISDRR